MASGANGSVGSDLLANGRQLFSAMKSWNLEEIFVADPRVGGIDHPLERVCGMAQVEIVPLCNTA